MADSLMDKFRGMVTGGASDTLKKAATPDHPPVEQYGDYQERDAEALGKRMSAEGKLPKSFYGSGTVTPKNMNYYHEDDGK